VAGRRNQVVELGQPVAEYIEHCPIVDPGIREAGELTYGDTARTVEQPGPAELGELGLTTRRRRSALVWAS
jgi:hypothetical protein